MPTKYITSCVSLLNTPLKIWRRSYLFFFWKKLALSLSIWGPSSFFRFFLNKIWLCLLSSHLGFHQTRRYGPLRGPTSSSYGGPPPRLFLPFGQKRQFIMLFRPIFGNFWCPLVTLVTFSRNLSNFEENPKKTKNPKKIKKFQKIK